GREGAQLLHHGVEGVFEFEDFAANVHGDFAREVATGHGGCHFGDVADLAGQVAGHEIDVVGKVLPGAADTGYLSLAAELAFGSDFAGYAGDFTGEGVELIDHGVDGVFQLKNLALHVYGNFAREVAACDSRCDFSDIANLASEIAGHEVHVVGQILPRSGYARHQRLASQLPIGSDFTGYAGDFAGEAVELVHHGVQRFLELQDFSANVHRDFA